MSREAKLEEGECPTPNSPSESIRDSDNSTDAPARTRLHFLSDHLNQDVDASIFTEIQLIILTFCTGIQDATTFLDFHCFASNQTGNTVFLCLALLVPELNGEMFTTQYIGIALGLFLGAGWLTGQIGHLVGPRKRWWLIFCNLLQTALVLGAAGIQFEHGLRNYGADSLAVIGMLAFAAGSQVVQPRSLAMTEITTAMATAAWVDLMIDRKLFSLKNRSRNRRVTFLFALIGGSLIGALIQRHVGSATAIVLSGGGKLLVTLLYGIIPAKKVPRGTKGSGV